MSGYTKGPWRALEGRNGWQIHTNHANGKGAAHINHWIANIKCESCPANKKANARLIAAAPELLEALETALVVMEVEYITNNRDDLANFMEMARMAIKKAKGE